MPQLPSTSPGMAGLASLSFPPIGAQRVRSYVFRLPLFTRAVAVAVAAVWVLGVVLRSVWDMRAWGALVPAEFGLGSLYRLNTFPFIHLNVFHALLNMVALTPLMERFESEHGTLMSIALFFGPLTSIPAVLYVLVEQFIMRGNTAVMGVSIWVFLLLGSEAIRTYRANPYLTIGTHSIPTWTTPLLLVLFMTALVPGSSLLGHLCGLGVGYVWGLGYLKILAPPEWALRFIEGKLNLLGLLPHYVSVDQKTYGRFGVLPTTNAADGGAGSGVALGLVGSPQRAAPE